MAEALASTEVVRERFRARLAAAKATAAPSASDIAARQRYLAQAAVLHVFDLAALTDLLPERPQGGAVPALLDDSGPALGFAAPLRTLTLAARREGMRHLGDRQAMRDALANAPDRSMTDVQRVFEAWLKTGELPLARLPLVDLRAAMTVADWELDGFPSAAAVANAVNRRTLVGPFEALAKGFVGRVAELDALHEFLGLQHRSVLKRIVAAATGGRATSLVVHGVGGVGKTALVAQLVLEYFDRADEFGDLPFVYLAFDNQALDPAEPITIIAAALRQLEAQIETWLGATASKDFGRVDHEVIVDARDELRAGLIAYAEQRRSLRSRASKNASQRQRIGDLRELDSRLFDRFATLLNALAPPPPPGRQANRTPLLFVLDTFEEVEYRPSADLAGFWMLLDRLTATVPQLRLLIVGRSMPESAELATFSPRALALGDLTAPDARALLAGFGVGDEALASAVIDQLGRNPLTLRLAALALNDELTPTALSSVKTHSFGLFRVGQEVIQGQLYRRILDHIHDPDVRRLAHPGMVLRRVTAELIKDVLAPTIGLNNVDTAKAEQLFATLSHEHSLVRRAAEGALLYREDVRRPMLAALTADRPSLTAMLHHRAADYYRWQDDEISRAEHIYHELMLPDPPLDDLSLRWRDGIASRLAGAIDELPAENRPWLASMMSLKLSEAHLAKASAAERDRILGREVLRLTQIGDFEAAEKRLARYPVAPDSPLTVLHARSLLALGRRAEAVRRLVEALADFPPFGDRERLAELLWFAGLATPDDAAAANWLERLVAVTMRLEARLPVVQALTELVARAAPERSQALKSQLATELGAMQLAEVDTESSIVRLALVRLGPRDRPLWQRFVPDLIHEIRPDDATPPIGLLSLSERMRMALEPLAVGDPLARLRTKLGTLNDSQLIAEARRPLLDALAGDTPDAIVLPAIWEYFRTEALTLDASTLAGLSRDRFYEQTSEAAA